MTQADRERVVGYLTSEESKRLWLLVQEHFDDRSKSYIIERLITNKGRDIEQGNTARQRGEAQLELVKSIIGVLLANEDKIEIPSEIKEKIAEVLSDE